MNAKYSSLKRYLIVVSLLISSIVQFSVSSFGFSIDDGVSKYNINQSVKYQVDLNYTFTHNGNMHQSYYFKVARLNDRQPNSTITQFTPPFQESKLLYNSITGWDDIQEGHLDKFNNTYDLFNATLDRGDTLTMSQNYNITLNEIDFENINDGDIGTYTPGDEIHDLYMVNEQYYNTSNPELIALSNSIVNPSDNPVEKARDLFNWVVSNIEYEVQDDELSAFMTYDQGVGDCSDYSVLLITLLRIQGIPARKVTGFLITNKAGHNPKAGNTYSFDLNFEGATLSVSSTNDILGHAWVEYYVPSVGWIACDPTWGNDYFNHVDFLRFNLNIGAWFFLPGASPGSNLISEFPINPSPVCSDHSAYSYQYSIEIMVLESDLIPEAPFPVMLVIFISAGAIIPIMIIVLMIKKRGKN